MKNVLPPGPKGSLLFGNALQVRKDPLGFLARCSAEYGDVALVRFGRQKVYLLNHPEHIKKVLVTESANFRKAKHHSVSRLRKFLSGGEYLYQLIKFPGDDEFWPREGSNLRPSFQKAAVEGYREIMVQSIEGVLLRWRSMKVVDIHQEMMKLALEVASTALFGRLATEDREMMLTSIEVIMREIVTRAGNPIQWFPIIPTPRNLELRKAVDRMDEILDKLIDQCPGEPCGFLLKSLLQSDRNRQNLRDPEWRFQLIALLIAGYETTAVALTWTWYLLSQHPDVKTRLWAELEQFLDGRIPTLEESRSLKYTEAVIKETLRLYPPIWLYALRWTLKDQTFGSYILPAGTAVLISPWVTHRDPRYFKDASIFRPDRWMENDCAAMPDFSYIPFGAGLRRCVGSHFAMLETLLTIAAIAQRYELILLKDAPVHPRPYVGLRPSQPMTMELRNR